MNNEIFFVAAFCHLPSIPHGTFTKLRSDCHNGACPLKAYVVVRCDPGYYLEGYGTLFCDENTSWHKPLPTCEGKSESILLTIYFKPNILENIFNLNLNLNMHFAEIVPRDKIIFNNQQY